VVRIFQKKNDKDDFLQSKKSSENFAEAYRKLSPYLNIGIVWAILVFLFTWIGIKLDKSWQTEPWFTLLGSIFGITTGFYHFIKTVSCEEKKNKKTEEK
jgi:F0F1-type ATP synthase assembly protein I